VRSLHYWGAGLIALPSFLIIVTGILLLLKNNLPYISPVVEKVSVLPATITLNEIYTLAQTCSKSSIKSIDIRPEKKTTRVRFTDDNEAQLDLLTKKVLSCKKRYVSFLISLHEGSYFSEFYKNFIMTPTAFILFLLWLSGVYLFVKTKRKIS